MFSITHNMSAMNAQRQFNQVSVGLKKTTEKVSSGYRINRAADDAAGLTISEKMRSQIRGLNQGADNIQDGISLMQIADGALAEVSDMVHRLNELSIKSANGTNTSQDRMALQAEADQILEEIDRIGATTEFNTMKIFDKSEIEKRIGPITNLVTSPSADLGHMKEAYQYPGDGKYYPAATLDFSKITADNIDRLNGCFFSFNCGLGCSEVFHITFITGQDGNQSTYPSNLNTASTHKYVVDISGCTSGPELTSRVMDFIQAHPSTNHSSSDTPKDVSVSHATSLTTADGGNTLVIYTNRDSYGRTSAADAKNTYSTGTRGGVNFSSLTSLLEQDPVLDFNIQCSNSYDDCELIHTRPMNSEILGLSGFDITTQEAAQISMDRISNALSTVSSHRSEYGAFQNRLEHSYANVMNIAENTQAAESAIRDADMATEIANMTKDQILSQAGIAMMTQANMSKEGILTLLQ